jgi:predicted O-methyltransferase YrrM
MKIPPYSFTGPYKGTYLVPHQAMDPRHVYMMFEILNGWPFKTALEIGSFFGASSTAFIEAINRGSAMQAVFCDLTLSPSLHSVLFNCNDPDRIRTSCHPSTKVLDLAEVFDFILVDASHDLESVTEELERLVPRRPLCVMAHDTNATDAGYPMCEGAKLLRETFQAMPEYFCLEDAKKRDGEKTERGLFFATTSPELFDLATKVFEKWS